MNRAQRRAAAKAPAPKAKSVNINWGHDGNLVLVRFSQKITMINFTIAQAEDAIRMLTAVKDALKAHQAQQALANAGAQQ